MHSDRRRCAGPLPVLAVQSHIRLGGARLLRGRICGGVISRRKPITRLLAAGPAYLCVFHSARHRRRGAASRVTQAPSQRIDAACRGSIVWAIAGAMLIGIRLIGHGGYPAVDALRAFFSPRAISLQPPVPTSSMGRRSRWSPSQAGRTPTLRGGWVRHPRRSGSILGRTIKRALAAAHRRRADRRPLPPRFPENQLHPVRRRQTLWKVQLDRDDFIRYAKLYGPSAILCWSPHARRFCKENPDLIRVLDDDKSVLLGRVIGFEGHFLDGIGKGRGRGQACFGCGN